MSDSFSRALAARSLLSQLPQTAPKKYRDRLKDFSAGLFSDDSNAWTRLLEELKHKTGLAEEIDRIIEDERRAEEKVKNAIEAQRLQKAEHERKMQEKAREAHEQRKSIENLLFGDFEAEECDIEPSNVCRYSFDTDGGGGGGGGRECR